MIDLGLSVISCIGVSSDFLRFFGRERGKDLETISSAYCVLKLDLQRKSGKISGCGLSIQ